MPFVREKPRATSHRHKSDPSSLQRVATTTQAGFRIVVATLMEHNLPLAASSGLAILGVIANGFALLFWWLLDRQDLVWKFVLSGLSMWLFAAGILCLFPPSAAPRHSSDR